MMFDDVCLRIWQYDAINMVPPNLIHGEASFSVPKPRPWHVGCSFWGTSDFDTRHGFKMI